MAIKLGFEQQINISVKQNDLVYFTDTVSSGGYNTADLDDLVLIGPVISINRREKLYTTNIKTFEADFNQTTFDLNGYPWEDSFDVPTDVKDFIVRVNGTLYTPTTPNPYTISSGVVTFTTPFINQEQIEFQLLYTLNVDDSSFVPPVSPVLDNNSFIMFKKNEVINTSGVKGYYAEVKFKNNSIEKAELFAVSSEIVQSSK